MLKLENVFLSADLFIILKTYISLYELEKRLFM